MTPRTRKRSWSAVVLVALCGAVMLSPSARPAIAASTVCALRQISTKQHNSGVCVRYVHTILIGDGVELEKPSTSTRFTAISRTAVKRFQLEQVAVVKKVTGIVGPATWSALCTAAAKRRLAEFELAGCGHILVPAPIGPAPDYKPTSLTVASWNVLASNKPSQVAAGAKAISEQADLLGFQELNFKNRRTQTRQTLVGCSTCVDSGYFPDPPGNGWATKATVSLIWNKQRFTALKTGTYTVLGRNAYGANTSNKWINWVLLRDDATGRRLYFLNTHLTAGVETAGVASARKPEQKNFRHHMKDLVALIKKFTTPGVTVIVAGDFNVNYRLDHTVSYFPRLSLNAINLRSGWERFDLAGISPSSGSIVGSSRIVDYVFTADGPALQPVAATIGAQAYSSDHYPVFYTATVSPIGDAT